MNNPLQSCLLMDFVSIQCVIFIISNPLFGLPATPNLHRFVDAEKDAGLMLLKRLCSTTSTMELLLASTGLTVRMGGPRPMTSQMMRGIRDYDFRLAGCKLVRYLSFSVLPKGTWI